MCNSEFKSRKIILFFLTLVISLPLFGQITDKNYKIFSVKLNKEVSLNEIITNLNSADVLFFGEEHNDSVAHYLEHKIFELMYGSFNNKLSLSLEMFERDVQTVMNEYLNGFIREKNFIKDARVWNNYKDYRPMIEFAKKNKLDVICANAAGRYTNIAGRKGQQGLMDLPEESKKFFAPLPYDTATGKYYEKLLEISSHNMMTSKDTSSKRKSEMMPVMKFNLPMSQSLWDATMAYSIAEYYKLNKDKKIFHVNGRFHSDEGFAVPNQLKKYAPEIKSIIISSFSDEAFNNLDWTKYKHLGDFIIVTDPLIPKTYKQ